MLTRLDAGILPLKIQQTLDIVISIGWRKDYPMAQFVVRDLEEEVKARLKRRAERHGRSMEDEVRHILRNAVKESGRPITSLGSRIAARFTDVGLSTALPELHGQAPRSAEFKP